MSELSPPAFRRFVLERILDLTGVSGVGAVALGCVFPSGRVVTQWRETAEVGPGSIAVYDSLDQVVAIHGHDGSTVIRFIDRPDPVLVLGGEAGELVPAA